MAPEFFNTNHEEFSLPTHESDIFALGMVAFEVSVYHRRPFNGFESPSRTSGIYRTSAIPGE